MSKTSKVVSDIYIYGKFVKSFKKIKNARKEFTTHAEMDNKKPPQKTVTAVLNRKDDD